MSEPQWYYSRAGQQFGPMPRGQLDQLFFGGQLLPTDFVWTAGMPQWLPLTHVYPAAPPAPYVPGVSLGYAPDAYQVHYAEFWRRFAAWFIDQVLLFAVNSAINLPVTFRYGARVSDNPTIEELKMRTAFLFLNLIVAWLYYAVLESSPAQATLGKLLLGIGVTDLGYQRISFVRATGRFFGKLLSTLIVFIGFIMAGFTQRSQALHDMLAGTLVIRKQE